MRIGIIGAGRVGSALASGWASRGHEVTLGVQDGSRAPAIEGVRADTVANVLAVAEVIVLALPFDAVPPVLAQAPNLNGRIVIDCTNPLLPDASGLLLGFDTSGAERTASLAAGASVFKTLNQIGAEHMSGPDFPTGRPLMLVAGDDAARKPTVLGLVEELGFEAIDAGGLKMARLIEPLGMPWVRLAYAQGPGRNIAFALPRR